MSREPEKWMLEACRKIRVKIHNLNGRPGTCTAPDNVENSKWLDRVSEDDAKILAAHAPAPAAHSDKLCELCEPRNAAAMRALELLTPGGSEFVNDIQRCVAHVRESQAAQMRAIVDIKKRERAAPAAQPDELKAAWERGREETADKFRDVFEYDANASEIEASLRSLRYSGEAPQPKGEPNAGR